MATIVLTAAGSLLGPIGGAAGTLLGQSIDGHIFGPKGRQGPRLQDLKVQTSSYGAQIPKLFGTMRVAGTVIWAAGVQGSPLGAQLAEQAGVELDRGGRVPVDEGFALAGHPEVRVLGDLASTGLPGIAPVAMQQGKAVADNLLRELRGEPRQPFRYFDKGQMATIGKRRAVVETGQLRFGGVIAWLGWLFIHILYLINFRNRVSVMLNWVWSYVFTKRNARLIVGKQWRSYEDGNEL